MDKQKPINFEMLKNCADELLIAFPCVGDEPDEPFFIFDTKNQSAVLYKQKSKQDKIIFSLLPDSSVEPLGKVKKILCVEIQDKHVRRQYLANVERFL